MIEQEFGNHALKGTLYNNVEYRLVVSQNKII